jgi:hypothetical protein
MQYPEGDSVQVSICPDGMLYPAPCLIDPENKMRRTEYVAEMKPSLSEFYD